PTVVARLFATRSLLGAQRVQLTGRHVVVISEAAFEHVAEDRSVAIHSPHLKKWSLIVVEAEPRHRIDDSLNRFGRRPLEVRVLDAQDECAVLSARECPAEQRRPDVAEVQEARRAWRKTRANYGFH